MTAAVSINDLPRVAGPFMDPLLAAADYYDVVASRYDDEVKARREYLAGVDDIVASWIAKRHIKTMVDVGCGTGIRLERLLAPAVCVGIGLDASEQMVAAARRRGLSAYRADIAAPDFVARRTEDRTELVTALWNVLGHIDGPVRRQRAMRNMRAMLDPGGLLIFDVNNRYNVAAYGWPGVVRNLVCDPFRRQSAGDFVIRRTIAGREVATVTHLFSVGEVRSLAANAGFRVVEICFVDYRSGGPAGRWTGQICVAAEAC